MKSQGLTLSEVEFVFLELMYTEQVFWLELTLHNSHPWGVEGLEFSKIVCKGGGWQIFLKKGGVLLERRGGGSDPS